MTTEKGKRIRTVIEKGDDWLSDDKYRRTQVHARTVAARVFMVATLVLVLSAVILVSHFAMVQYPIYQEVGVYERAILESPDATVLLQRLQDYRVLLDEKLDGSEHYSIFFPNYHNSMELYMAQIDSMIERVQDLETWYLGRGYDTELEDVYQEKLDNIMEGIEDIMAKGTNMGLTSKAGIALSIEQNTAFHLVRSIAGVVIALSVIVVVASLVFIGHDGFYEWRTIKETLLPPEEEEDEEEDWVDDGEEVVNDV